MQLTLISGADAEGKKNGLLRTQHGFWISADCWDGHHERHNRTCLAISCECPCHRPARNPAKAAKHGSSQMHVLDCGCGLIEIA